MTDKQDLYQEAMKFAKEKASISYVQRKCRCSYNDAERMLEQMVSDGVISTYNGRKGGEAVGAGGVQALSAAPEAIAKLRHLYKNMVNGAVRDTASAKRIAEGLLAPAIEALERATPPAEQQATKAAPGELFDSEGFRAWVQKNLPDETIIGNSAWWADHLTTWAQRFVKAPPQQEAKEPAAISEAIERMAADRYKVVPSHESMLHRWAVVAGTGTQQLYLGREVECQNMARKFAGAFLDGAFVAMQRTAPQPAPALLSDDVVKDAARYRWLIDQHWIQTEVDWRLISTDQDSTIKQLDAAIDAALASQGGK